MHKLLGIRHGTGDKAWGRDDKPDVKSLGGHQRAGPRRKAPKNLKGLKLGKRKRRGRK